MANIKTLKDLTPGTVFDAGPIDVRVLDHMTNGTTSEWIGRRRLRASVDRTLGVKVPKAVFDEAEAYARRKMAFQNEALGLDRGDEYLELLIPDVIREMALAARYDGRRATA